MTSDSLKLYKLIILYFLSRTKQPMPNAIISDFILDNNYTDYFSIQQTLANLTEDKMIEAEQTYAVSYYTITQTGREMLDLFGSRLPSDTKHQIDNYLRENKVSIVENTTIHTDFKRLGAREYLAKGSIIEHGNIIMEVSINVPTEEEAMQVCKRFKEKNQELYSLVFKNLMMD